MPNEIFGCVTWEDLLQNSFIWERLGSLLLDSIIFNAGRSCDYLCETFEHALATCHVLFTK